MDATVHMPLSDDAALVTALAGTAMPFSHSTEDEIERWLRVLRLHGRAGDVLQALGVGERPLPQTGESAIRTAPPLGSDALDRALRLAERRAQRRHADAVETSDLLLALFDVYGTALDEVLQLRGTSRSEIIERLDA